MKMKKAVLIRQGKKVGQRFFWRKQTKGNLIKKLIMRKEKKVEIEEGFLIL